MADNTLIFPSGIDNSTNRMMIVVKELTQVKQLEDIKSAKDVTAEQKAIAGSIFGMILLPLPNSLQDSTTHNWEVAEGLTQEAGGAINSIAGAFANKFGGMGDLAKSGIVKMARKAGYNIDPKYWQMYNGTMPRQFTFDWTFIPENKIDADNMMKIIKLLKYSAAPGSRGTTSLLLDSPFIFTIKFINPVLQDTIRLKDIVCTAINIDYMGQGYSDFFYDGSPKQVKLSMTFAERHTLYKQDYSGSYSEGYMGEG